MKSRVFSFLYFVKLPGFMEKSLRQQGQMCLTEVDHGRSQKKNKKGSNFFKKYQ